MFGRLAVLLGFLIATHVSYAQDREKLLGTWKLVSFEMEYQASGERKFVYGKEPKGYVVFTPEGRMMTVITGEGRNPAKTDEDRAALLRTMIAYTGALPRSMLLGLKHLPERNRYVSTRSMAIAWISFLHGRRSRTNLDGRLLADS